MFSNIQQRQLSVDSRIEDIQIRSIVFQGQSFHTERCAMILHTMLDNWAFVRYSTLKHSLQTDSDFFQMGNTTLFVEDLSHLSILEQLILSRFLQKASLESEIPVIVFGTTRPLSELHKERKISAALFEEIHRIEIDTRRLPATMSKIEDCLEMLLFSTQPFFDNLPIAKMS